MNIRKFLFQNFTKLLCFSALLILSIVLSGLHDSVAEEPASQTQAVIFTEDFEDADFAEWDADSNHQSERIVLTDNPENVYHGQYAAKFTIKPNGPKGAKLNKWFMPGYDQIYTRFYFKFAEDFDQGNLMHWVHILGNRVDDKWSAFGQAGIRPSGDDFFSIGIEPWRAWGQNPPPGVITFYTYHMNMPQDPNSGKYWGESFISEPPFQIEPGRWYGMQTMVKANTPGQADGEQALWIDGEKVIHTRGLRFRTTRDVRLNGFWLSLYLHDTPQTNTCWFDELVISTKPIGLLPSGI